MKCNNGMVFSFASPPRSERCLPVRQAGVKRRGQIRKSEINKSEMAMGTT
ncbi:MAG: hypothetical protein M9904_16075 [Chitinophagaceae bacterium]|nr:hypothetical protein [Chitinophagaceae bacterium]